MNHTFLANLTVEDIPALEKIELRTKLSFWGNENYQRFLREYPEYFGCKAVILPEVGEDLLAGFLLARCLFENLEILKVAVLPEYHRRGIGTRLMEAAYSEAMMRGCQRCFLEVRKSNHGAIQFYLTQRFKVAGMRANYYSEPVEDALIMERPF
jgi:ribosomal-protein-alanine N-acetyltransferase